MSTVQTNNQLLKDIRILVAEDNLINQKVMLHALQRQNAVVEIVGNGQLAIDKLNEKDFDILLMDLHMPVMDGETTALYIRNELKNNIPILAITADVIKEKADHYEDMGMNGYVLKPFDFNDLYERILQQVKKA
jgi:CheY-like chemotaxis protein